MTSSMRTFLFGIAAGAALTVFATDAIPKMAAKMMQKMMSRMRAEGSPAEK